MRPPFPDDEPRRFDGDEPDGWRFSLTPGGLGLFIFLISLFMLFAAAMFGYIFVRLTNPHAPPLGTMNMPVGLWISTVILLISGVTMHLSHGAAVRGESGRTRSLLVVTLLLGVVFLAIQIPALNQLMAMHWQEMGVVADDPDAVPWAMYGFTAVLIVLHGMHVLGGFVPLGWLTWRALQDSTPPPHPLSVRHMEVYWHFLHVVWLVMFLVFFFLG